MAGIETVFNCQKLQSGSQKQRIPGTYLPGCAVSYLRRSLQARACAERSRRVDWHDSGGQECPPNTDEDRRDCLFDTIILQPLITSY